ncbi:uncharacterized protein RJT21DRAFT_122536 [Scheffersomyces amazonensis]|uniref:uncharacterized protein n=1 Tax=Scheffersomyces amazonensis TaxID=1078765 RepID=UPI00315C7B09
MTKVDLLINDTTRIISSEDKGLLLSLLGSNPYTNPVGSISLVLLIGLIYYTFIYKREKGSKKSKSPAATHYHLQKNRTFGEWIPDYNFKTPTPTEFKNWDIKLTKPIPYRAFKHKYHITMGIRSMDWNSWVELDNQWEKYHNDKLNRLQERGTECYNTSEKAWEAGWELLAELKTYLSIRYPTLFVETDIGLNNLVTGEKFDFRRREKTGAEEDDPCLIAGKLLQDDIAIMIEHDDGNYSLEGGSILLAGFWRLKDKFQMKLNEIHTSGDVPHYESKLQNGMTKFFQRLTCDKPVVRNNYFIQTDDNLGWSHSIGNEDDEVVGWYTAKIAKDVQNLYFRSERQSLRRLPISGAVIFTIRTYFIPVVELCQEPYIPRRLLNGIASWNSEVEEYKGYQKYKDVLMPYLEAMAQQQEANGLAIEDEPQVFPF